MTVPTVSAVLPRSAHLVIVLTLVCGGATVAGCSRKTEEMPLAIWQGQGGTPVEYTEAACAILIALDEKHELLTPGAVIDVLGPPTSFSTVGYVFDASGNTIGDVARLTISYAERWVHVNFALCGTVKSVVYDAGTRRQGKQALVWPRAISNTSLPVVRGSLLAAPNTSELLRLAADLAEKEGNETYWHKRIREWPPDYPVSEYYQGPCHVDVLVADLLAPDLARVLYRIKGEHLLYCETWWSRGDGNSWQTISEDDAKDAYVRWRTEVH